MKDILLQRITITIEAKGGYEITGVIDLGVDLDIDRNLKFYVIDSLIFYNNGKIKEKCIENNFKYIDSKETFNRIVGMLIENVNLVSIYNDDLIIAAFTINTRSYNNESDIIINEFDPISDVSYSIKRLDNNYISIIYNIKTNFNNTSIKNLLKFNDRFCLIEDFKEMFNRKIKKIYENPINYYDIDEPGKLY